MGLLVKLSWRNLWRNKRRTIVTIAAVTFASAVFMFTRGMQYGTYEVNIQAITHLFSGPLQIQHRQYQENPTLYNSFVFSDSLLKAVLQIPGVQAVTPRLYSEGLIAFNHNSLGASLIAIDPRREASVTTLFQKIKQGRFLKEGKRWELVVGETLMKNLHVQVGDSVVILTQGFDGSMGNMKFKIVGAIRTGAREMDQFGVLLTLPDAWELLTMGNRIHALVVDVKDLQKLDEVQKAFQMKFKGTTLVALTWETLLPELKQGIQLDNVSGLLFLILLVIVVAFGILNTILMSVTERFREFGIMLSLGMRNAHLSLVVLWEGIFLTTIGLTLGVTLAGIVNYYFQIHPIVFGGELAKLSEEYGFLPVLSNTVEPRVWIQTIVAILSISLLALIYPLLKVLHLEPLKGIRYT